MKRIDADLAMTIFCCAVIVACTQAVGIMSALSSGMGLGAGILTGLILIPVTFIVVGATKAALYGVERFFARHL